MYACAKFPGRVHDSAVFSSSSLYGDLHTGVVWHGVQGAFRPCLLVDSAYPLLPFTMKRFNTARNAGSARQKAFDKALGRGRNPIERAWGRLVARWHICDALPPKELSGVPGIIVACMVLHNYCELFDPMVIEGDEDDLEEVTREGVLEAANEDVPAAWLAAGRAQRDAVADWLVEHRNQ